MQRLVIVLTFVLWALPSGAFAQGCPAGTSTMVFNPTKYSNTLPEHTTKEADGTTDRVSEYQMEYVAQGADPATAMPVAGPVTVPKTAFTLVAGTTTCYQANLPLPVPAGNTPLVAAIRARRTGTASIPAADSPWAVSGNPFAVAPSVLAPLGSGTVSR